ncbi:MAG: LapA family protein [Clostridia bacterium]|nr:LapA family protein [Clostridia bacterium]MDD4047231.1 LapA family protein [Clostridia bacterium]
MQFYLVSSLLFAMIVALFAIQNTEIVIIKFLAFEFSVSLVLVILGSAIIGALILYLLSLFKQFGSWFKFRQVRQQKENLEKQINDLIEKIAVLEEGKQELLINEEENKENKTDDIVV